ncbi:ROK family protein [Tessaracoccus sp. Y36]
MILALDLGGTNLRAGLVGPQGVAWSGRKPSQEVLSGGLTSLRSTLGDLIKRAEGHAEAVVMGFPGTVARDHRTVLTVTNIPGFNGFDFASMCERDFGLPGIADTDVNLLLRDHLSQLSTVPRVACAFYLGTGLGNSIAIDGQIFAGAHGVAGELGHIPWGSGQHRCKCGLPSCIEPDVSGMAVARTVADHPDLDSVADFFENAPASVIDGFIDGAAKVVATEINILDPDAVILGGGVFESPCVPRARVEESILAHVRRPLPHDDIAFTWVPGDLSAGLRGGWNLYQEKFK